MKKNLNTLIVFFTILFLTLFYVIFLYRNAFLVFYYKMFQQCSTQSMYAYLKIMPTTSFISSCILIIILVSFLLYVSNVIKVAYGINSIMLKIQNPPFIKKMEDKLRLKGKIRVIMTKDLFAFCYGFLHQKIYISQGFLKNFTSDEIEIILRHEAYHYKKRHYLIRLILHGILSVNIFLPILKDYVDKIILHQEISADNYSIQSLKDKYLLISILKKTLSFNNSYLPYVASINNELFIVSRIRALTGYQIHSRTYALKNIFYSGVFISIMIFLIMFFPYHVFARDKADVLTTMLVGPQSQEVYSCQAPAMFSSLENQ